MSFKYAAYYNTFIYATEKREKSPHTLRHSRQNNKKYDDTELKERDKKS